VRSESLIDEYRYTRDKAERELLFTTTSKNRVVDMRINNYDKIIDLEIFLLKLFIPIFGISFAVGTNIFGINTHALKCLSLLIIILVGLLILVTLFFRKKTVDAEQARHNNEVSSIEKGLTNKMEKLETDRKQLEEDLKLAVKNEPNLQ
jgi:hypothetical protein